MLNTGNPRSVFEPGFSIRSGLKAGRTMCYQEINGIWYPMIDPNNPPISILPTSVPSNSNVQWLSCQSCQGTRVNNSALQYATCEVCRM
jgi:hypothetical protein